MGTPEEYSKESKLVLTDRSLYLLGSIGKSVSKIYPHKEDIGVIVGVSFDVAGCNQLLIKHYERTDDSIIQEWLMDKILKIDDESNIVTDSVNLDFAVDQLRLLGTTGHDKVTKEPMSVASIRFSFNGCSNLHCETHNHGRKDDYIRDINIPDYLYTPVSRVMEIAPNFAA